MQVEETSTNNQELKTFNFPGGILKKEITAPIDLSGQSDCAKNDTENSNLPRGELKNPYRVHYEGFDDIEVAIIEIFDKVTFKTKGTKPYPILLTDGNKYFCVYNSDYVESALAAEDHTIRCMVKHVDATLSDRLLAVKATGLRIKPEGDPVRYAEVLFAFSTIFEDYEDSGINTAHVEHGGARRGEAFKFLKEDDFIDNVLVHELGKSRQAILNYKSDSSFIGKNLFEYLIQQKAGKDFFEKLRRVKSEALRKVEDAIKEEDFDFTQYTIDIINDDIRNALVEYKLTKHISDFTLLTCAENGYLKDEVRFILSQIDKCMGDEIEQQKLDSLNSHEETKEEVKFPNFENTEGNQSGYDGNELLIAEVKILHDELGKLINSNSVTNFKTEALAICGKLLKLLTA